MAGRAKRPAGLAGRGQGEGAPPAPGTPPPAEPSAVAKFGPSPAPRAPLAAILEAEGVRHFEKEIRMMSREELLAEFASRRSGRPVATRIIKNIIWQAWEWLNSGKLAPFEGNIRSFWYSHVKVPLDRVGILAKHHRDHYNTMLEAFGRFVEDLDLFCYFAFGFTDESWENRRIGKAHPDIIVCSEKNGFFRLLREIHEEFDVTVTAFGGQPSLLATEYLAQHIRGELRRPEGEVPVKVVTIVDWDPAGANIVETFERQLADQGLVVKERVDVVRPEAFTEEERRAFRYALSGSKYRQPMNRKWVQESGGVDGESYGLEADALPRPRLSQLFRSSLGIESRSKPSTPLPNRHHI